MNENIKNWFAIYTMPRWEKKVHSRLLRKDIRSWCPMQKVERRWSDRKKIIEDPIFKSYVFVQIHEEERLTVLQTDGVLNDYYSEAFGIWSDAWRSFENRNRIVLMGAVNKYP